MNVVVRAGLFSAKSEAVKSTVFVQVNIDHSHITPVEFRLCPNTTIISVNGHSISAIAPDFEVRRETTSVSA